MPHPETVHRRREVVPDLLLLRVEPHPLSDEGLVRPACRAPHRERHLEADDQAAGLARARAKRVFVVQFVWVREALLVGRDVAVEWSERVRCRV